MKKIIIAVVIIGIFISVVLLVKEAILTSSGDTNVTTKQQKINFRSINETVYYSARAWGLGGNHEEIVISPIPIENNHRAYTKESCYVFYTSEIYYKKNEDNSELIIYVSKSMMSEPVKFDSQVNIRIHDLKTADALYDYKNNYKKYGLTRISVFNDL